MTQKLYEQYPEAIAKAQEIGWGSAIIQATAGFPDRYQRMQLAQAAGYADWDDLDADLKRILIDTYTLAYSHALPTHRLQRP